MEQRTASRNATIAVLAWGAVLAIAACRHFFLMTGDTFFDNVEGQSYLLRAIEFRDCLAHGQWSPQWCVDFRGGLGSPYFGYYQPGYFYAESLVPGWFAPLIRAGCVLSVFTWIGYCGAAGLVARRFGAWAGALAGTLLVTARFAATDLYVRSDWSEYGGWMWFVLALNLLDRFCERPSRLSFGGATLVAALVVITHPVVALFGYGFLLGWVVLRGCWLRGGWSVVGGLAVLAGGAVLSAFYWLPVLAEWSYVAPHKAFAGHYFYGNHFVSPWDLVRLGPTATPVSVKIGWLLAFLPLASTGYWIGRRQRPTAEQAILLVGTAAVLAVSLFLMSRQSRVVWDHVGLIQRAQFPWRLLSFASLALACAGTAWVTTNRLSRVAAAMLCLASLVFVSPYPRQLPLVPLDLPQSARGLMGIYFRPDIQDEWLPSGADLEPGVKDHRLRADVALQAGRVVWSAGRLSCDVVTDQPATVTLPHYGFATGWRADLNGEPLQVATNPRGLLQVQLPSNSSGKLQVQFGMTPWRQRGWFVTAGGFVALIGAWLLAAIRQTRRDSSFPSSTSASGLVLRPT